MVFVHPSKTEVVLVILEKIPKQVRLVLILVHWS